MIYVLIINRILLIANVIKGGFIFINSMKMNDPIPMEEERGVMHFFASIILFVLSFFMNMYLFIPLSIIVILGIDIFVKCMQSRINTKG